MEVNRMSVEEIKQSIVGKLERNFGCEVSDATKQQLYYVLAQTVRDEVMQRRTASRGERKRQQAKKVYYLSAEFLVGRALHNNMVNIVNEKAYMQAMDELGLDHELIFEQEPEPGLGNGGLGRLAACFMDSLSSLNLPAMGCTIRYEYGMFRQRIVDGFQVETPDNWLENGDIWEIPRPDQTVEVHFGGYVEESMDEHGNMIYEHKGYNTVEATPYDMPIVGYDTTMVNMLRLWSARSPKRIDMNSFNRGQYAQAAAERELVESISKILYPEDSHLEGKELRLKQEYFFSSASVQYAINDFLQVYGPNWDLLPDKVAIHINDTHPAVAVPEMMRLLIDQYGLGWDRAEDICHRVFAYTNHTIMAEALERWPEDMFQRLLPRVYQILQEMNRRLCAQLWDVFPGQWERIGKLAIISYGEIHMANLAIVSGHTVNGVSQIHGEILKKETFKDYNTIYPGRFIGITNGITHRRWLMQCNRGLSSLIDESIGDGWRKDLMKLENLVPFATDPAFVEKFAKIKQENKIRLANHLNRRQGAVIDPNTIFDSQAKRLHEYKRQLMNILTVMMLYNRIVEDESFSIEPRTYLFGAKAAPGYYRAKLIIKLINSVAELVKKHPRASKMINIVFIENYCVSAAELLMPATDVSEQLSTAGKEASGTGNMKFMMNGAVTIGTMDGANVEIFQQVGPENIYIFGLSADEVSANQHTYRSAEIYETNPAIRTVLNQLIDGTLSPENPRMFQELYHSLLFGNGSNIADPYFVLKDMPSYLHSQMLINRDYQDRAKWNKMAIINTAKSGIFTSDRTIQEYSDKVWHLSPLEL